MTQRQQVAAAVMQVIFNEASIDEIDIELEDVCDETPINQLRQIPMNMATNQDENREPENEDEKTEDDDAKARTYFFSKDQVKSKFL